MMSCSAKLLNLQEPRFRTRLKLVETMRKMTSKTRKRSTSPARMLSRSRVDFSRKWLKPGRMPCVNKEGKMSKIA